MRTAVATMLSFLVVLSAPAGAGDPPADSPKPEARAEAADPASEPAADPAVMKIVLVPTKPPDEAAAAAADADAKPFVPPDGWRPKKRGKFTVYCRKDYNVKGTRFPTETCHDAASLRAMVQQAEIDRETFDQIRRICGNDSVCGTR